MLSGGASRVEGLAAALGERFEAPVETLDPFRKIAFDAKKFGLISASDAVPTAAVAVGLALRRADDR
jgi:type IV pilus assembly protein PilM